MNTTASQPPIQLSQRSDLRNTLDDLISFARTRNYDGVAEGAAELIHKLGAAHFNLVILGEFKRGKSTLINALLGKSLLPTAVVPLTSVVTVVGYGESPKATAHFINGSQSSVELDSIADYITEDRNPKNARGVKVLEIEFPSELLRAGVRIVDTPGVGSIYEHNTQATLDYLPEADAVIFLLTADQPASREEIALLNEARKHAPRLFIVQNKIDYLDAEQQAHSLDFLNRTVAKEIGGSVHIYPVSARAALRGDPNDSGEFEKLKNDLLQFLLHEKGEVLIRNLVTRAERLVNSASERLQLESRMAEMSTASIAEKIESFRSAAERIRSTGREAEYLLNAYADDLLTAIGNDLMSFADQKRQEAIAVVEAEIDANADLNNFKLVHLLKGVLRNQVEEIFQEWRIREEKGAAERFAKITEHFTQQADRIANEIGRLTEELFGTTITVSFEVEPLTTRTRHYYYTEDPFDYQFSRFRLLVPGRLGRRMIKRIFLHAMSTELSRNAARLRGDFQQRVKESARSFLSHFREKINDLLDEQSEMLSATATRISDAKAREDALSERNVHASETLTTLRENLQRVLQAAEHSDPSEVSL